MSSLLHGVSAYTDGRPTLSSAPSASARRVSSSASCCRARQRSCSAEYLPPSTASASPGCSLLVVICAVVGDSVGYEVGRRLGPSLLRRLPPKARKGADQSQEFLRRRGGPAIFLGRFTAVFRAVIPGVAGMSGMRYSTFLSWNALGGICWGAPSPSPATLPANRTNE